MKLGGSADVAATRLLPERSNRVSAVKLPKMSGTDGSWFPWSSKTDRDRADI